MRKADRLFQLTNLIRAKQPITAQQIATELNVSVRTVYRYIDDLSVSGIPIYGTTGIGYQLQEHFELPPLNLTSQELDALILGVKMVSGWTGDTLSEAARSLANKIQVVLPQQLREEFSDSIYAPNQQNQTKVRAIWEAFYTAIKNENLISIDYQAADGNTTSRVIYPLGLFYWGGKWTVGSWCTLRNSFRDFRLDRIIKLALSPETYTKDQTINLAAYFSAVEQK